MLKENENFFSKTETMLQACYWVAEYKNHVELTAVGEPT